MPDWVKHILIASSVAVTGGLLLGLREGSLILMNQSIYVASATDVYNFMAYSVVLHIAIAISLFLPFELIYTAIQYRKKLNPDPTRLIPIYIAWFCGWVGFLLLGWMKVEWVSTKVISGEFGWLGIAVLSSGVGVLIWYLIRLPLRADPTLGRIVKRSMEAIIIFLLLASIPLVRLQGLKVTHDNGPGSERVSGDFPNVIWITLCTARSDHLSVYGYHRKTTPRLERLAGEGALYENAISPSCWTRPSHASLFTGTFLSRHGVDNERRRIPKATRTFTEILRDKGYQTFGVSNNYNAGSHVGLDRGFDLFVEIWGPLRNKLMVIYWWNRIREIGWHIRINMCSAKETVHIIGTWFNRHYDPSRPFFLFVNFAEPHDPYLPPDAYAGLFLPDGVSPTDARNYCRTVLIRHGREVTSSVPLTEERLSILRSMYDAELRYQDDMLGRLIELISERQLLDKTILVIVGDHGEQFGEHGLLGHENSLYEPLLHVPLIMRYPARIEPGTRVKSLVQTTDIMPTTLSLLGIADTGGNIYMQGRDLFSEQAAPDRETMAVSEFDITSDNPMRMVRIGNWKLIESKGEHDELYDLENDPEESINQVDQETGKVTSMKNVLAHWLQASTSLVDSTSEAELGTEAVKMLESLGYISQD